MRIEELSEQEKAKSGGFTHRALIAFSLGDFTAGATTQVYNLRTSAPAGTVIQGAAFRVDKALLGGAISAATLQVGKTGTANAYITATSIFTGGTFYKAGDGASFNQAGGDALTTATNIIATVTTTDANVSAATQGEFIILLKLVDLNQF